MDNFEHLGLKDTILKGVYSYGFVKPSKIQLRGIKVIISKKDCILQSQSGTGKTATYLLGTLNNINEDNINIQSIVITPTRELAEQVFTVCNQLSKYSNIKSILCVGGTHIGKFKKELKNTHLIIGTIGRISHMIQENIINIQHLQQITLDEADNLLDKKYSEKILEFIKSLDINIQKCFLSATVNKNMRDISQELLNDPELVLLKKEEVQVKAIKNFYLNTEKEELKFETLIDLYNLVSTSHTMIFCNSINKIQYLQTELEKEGFPITTIHSALSQDERNNIVKDFRDGKTRILLTTDLLARGIDIPEVKLVINYDLPKSHETFIHRIGRSGRFGKTGISITFVKMDDFKDKKIFDSLKSHYSINIEEAPENLSDFLN